MNEQTSDTAATDRQQPTGSGYAPPQYAYGYGPAWYPPVQRTSVQAIATLVFGIASLTVLWGVGGIVALVLAPGAKREIEASQGTLGGAGLVRAGVICSWISIGLSVLVIVLVLGLFFVFGVSSGGVDTTITETGAGTAWLTR